VLYGEARLATPLVGDQSVLVAQGEEHAAKRALLQPLFQGERVEGYRELMTDICQAEIATWPLNQPIKLLPRLQRITLNVVMSAIFGVTGGARQDSLRNHVHAVLEWGSNAWRMAQHQFKYMRGWGPPKSFLRVIAPLNAQVYEEIERAKKDPKLAERDDILALLVQARRPDGNPMTDKEIRDQLVTLLIQGHTSTANGIAWSLERLMRHPEAFERLREEVQTGEAEEYLNAVIMETLRLRPPLPFVMRRVNKPFQLGEYELPPGIMTACNLYILHRRPDLYPEPDSFRPERFLDQRPPRYGWIPFGGGSEGRGCIGSAFALAEIKVVLRTLCQQVRLQPVDQRDEEINRLGVGFTPSRGAEAILVERVPAAGAAQAA
jgi:cytochrome P450 family 135